VGKFGACVVVGLRVEGNGGFGVQYRFTSAKNAAIPAGRVSVASSKHVAPREATKPLTLAQWLQAFRWHDPQ
jgi:hypothetical protein